MDNFKKKIELVDKSYKKMLKELHPIVKKFKKIYADLDDTQIDSLLYYKGLGAFTINKLLYENSLTLHFDKISSIADIVKNSYQKEIDNINILDNIINLYKSDTKIKVFRGIGKGKHSDDFNNKKKNDTHEFLNYLSTSVNPNVAYNFTDSYTSNISANSKKKPTILLEFNLPSNFNFFYTIWMDSIQSKNINTKKSVSKLNKYNNKSKKQVVKNEKFGSSEFEILLPRNCKFKITDISTIEEKFFSINYKMSWNNYEKHLNTNNNVQKIKVIHLDFVEFIDKELPSFNQININYSGIDKSKFDQLYYIPFYSQTGSKWIY